MPDVRLDVPLEIWTAWRNAAGEMGINIPSWCKVQIAENLRRKAGGIECPTAPVQDTVRDPTPGQTFIRNRIVEALAPVGDMIHENDVPKLAERLGLKSRSVFSSLGSMVGSGRVVHEGKVYKLVMEGY